MNELETLIQRLNAGLTISGQGSYQRRLPAAQARPDLHAARVGLRALVIGSPSAEAWRALSRAEEAFLNYPAAVKALESAIAASPVHERKDLKRLYLLRESAAQWKALSLTPELLAALAQRLESCLASTPCDHTLRHTRLWLKEQRVPSIPKVIRGIQQGGGYCDCEVVFNVV